MQHMHFTRPPKLKALLPQGPWTVSEGLYRFSKEMVWVWHFRRAKRLGGQGGCGAVLDGLPVRGTTRGGPAAAERWRASGS